MNDELRTFLESRLNASIHATRSLAGGGAARTVRVDTTEGPFVVKHIDDPASDTLRVEADGLARMAKTDSGLVTPDVLVLASGAFGECLVLEWLETVTPSREHHEALGRGLAAMHRHEGRMFGYSMDGWIGANRQFNTWQSTWPALFQHQRLQPQVAMAKKQGRWDAAWSPWLDTLYKALPNLLPEAPPASLLHGDCWNGNVLFLNNGQAALIDPAVYFGDRETDLAMTRLFGGFDGVFYAAYQEAWPLEQGYSERKPVYDLYHMLNHLNLFGGNYAAAVGRLLGLFR